MGFLYFLNIILNKMKKLVAEYIRSFWFIRNYYGFVSRVMSVFKLGIGFLVIDMGLGFTLFPLISIPVKMLHYIRQEVKVILLLLVIGMLNNLGCSGLHQLVEQLYLD